MADCRIVTTVAPVTGCFVVTVVLTRVGARADLMSMKEAALRAGTVIVNWVPWMVG